MQSESLSKWLPLIGIVGVFFSLIIFLFLILDLSVQNSYAESVLATSSQNQEKAILPARQVVLGLPIRIEIPKINVSTTIEHVGLTLDGAVGIPKDPANAAWFNLGPRPGDNGSAVITGHINWYYGAIGVFANLHEVKPGDKITVQDDKGAVISFVVRESRIYDAAADAIDVFSSNDGKSHLNLITCAGSWNKVKKSYSDRLIIFTDKE